MSIRREQLFSAKKTSPGSSVIPATVQFVHNKKKGMLEPLSPQGKLLCALRKVLADMSGRDGRWCILGNKVHITEEPSTHESED